MTTQTYFEYFTHQWFSKCGCRGSPWVGRGRQSFRINALHNIQGEKTIHPSTLKDTMIREENRSVKAIFLKAKAEYG